MCFKRFTSMLASKFDQPYSCTINWLRCRLCFSLLRASIQCIHGARSARGHASRVPAPPLELVVAKVNVYTFVIRYLFVPSVYTFFCCLSCVLLVSLPLFGLFVYIYYKNKDVLKFDNSSLIHSKELFYLVMVIPPESDTTPLETEATPTQTEDSVVSTSAAPTTRDGHTFRLYIPPVYYACASCLARQVMSVRYIAVHIAYDRFLIRPCSPRDLAPHSP